jgi:hypothetical protein
MPRNIFMILMLIISFIAMDGGHYTIFGKELSPHSISGISETYEGFFAGFQEDRVTIIDSKSYNLSSFKVSPSVKVTYRDNTIEKKDIIIHSIVRLIVINKVVEEIIVLEVAS